MTNRRNWDDPRDKKFRLDVRKRDNGCCKWPGCRNKKFTEVHHIFPRSKYPQYEYSIDHAILLCIKHHKMVTGKEDVYAFKLLGLVKKKYGHNS